MTFTPPDGGATAIVGGRIRQAVLLDVLPVVILGLVALGNDQAERTDSVPIVLAFVVLPLLARRRWPVPVLAIAAVGTLATTMSGGNPLAQVGSIALASFTVGDRQTDRVLAALSVVAVASLLSFGFIVQDADPAEAVALTFAVLVPSWLLGDLVHTRRREALRREEERDRSVQAREERLRAAAAEERRHVARELHDVVAHAVSVMVIQAGAARQVLRTAPDDAEGALLAVESTGREAMTELRRFLGALADDDEPGGLAPQPGIGGLGPLLDRVREAGLPASLEVQGEPRSVPPSLDVAVYRIVQEALTNALRYARRAATLVRLTWEPAQLRLEILDDGPGTDAIASSGRGLVGMRERASLVGGRLEAGPRIGGGYAVRAWLPLEPEPAQRPAT
jgi:signal transduction histidine kinase